MKLKKWKNNQEYVRAQRRLSRRKSGGVWVKPETVTGIVNYTILKHFLVRSGICHGVRTGKELELFKDRYPHADFVGTDIRAQDGVVEWDFHDVNPEWVGKFDFLYSNSLDHAHDPKLCTRVWMGQLKPEGLAFIEWSTYSRRIRGADCFGASLDEYMGLFGRAGKVLDLIYFPGKIHRTVLLVGRKK